jgi:pyruvate dehydrogenase E1 component
LLQTQERLGALDVVVAREGPERANFLPGFPAERAGCNGVFARFSAHAAYVSTPPVQLEARSPDNTGYPKRIRSSVG